MQLSDEQLDDFTNRWEHAFNERISRDEARTRAAELLELFSLLARRPPDGPSEGEAGAASPESESN